MFWLGLLVAEMAVLIGLMVVSEGYAAIRLPRDGVLLAGEQSVRLVHSSALHGDMRNAHRLTALMSREQYGRFRKNFKASCRERKIVDFKGL